jgi:hypothetical protein
MWDKTPRNTVKVNQRSEERVCSIFRLEVLAIKETIMKQEPSTAKHAVISQKSS